LKIPWFLCAKNQMQNRLQLIGWPSGAACPLRDPMVPMPSGQFRLDLPDFGLRIMPLRHDEPENRARQFRKTDMVVFDGRDQPFDMAKTPRRDDAEFGQMGAERIVPRRPLCGAAVA
jgi:hypothetical protein